MPTDDVLVVGGGPAGRAIAAECGRRGLRTALLDPAPDRPWRATYAAWSGELPPGFPAGLVAARAHGRAIALTEQRLGWEYAVLDVPALRRHLDAELDRAGVEVRAGRATGSPDPHGVALAGGGRARARLVVDAGGHHQPLRPRSRLARPAAEQTAYGLVVPQDLAAPFVGPSEALFMDWRRDHGEPGWPTFLYAVPLGGGAVLLEETSLARRPGLPLPVLRRRLLARLARHGVSPGTDARAERVRFPVDGARHRHDTAVAFGSAAPLVHPATGFSVAAALTLAPRVAEALARGLPTAPGAARTAARDVVWPRAARAVHVLRRRGLEALLRMPPDRVPAFFEVFFGLPPRHRWAYLTGRDDLTGTVAAMNALFGRSGWALRGRLVGPALLPPAPGLDAPATRAG
ncbi:lycopene cyclase family protein [Pseudonocardia acidicola]|uniref:Lycopene cyclase family protein n=1 Tax=Pseudonocardia acidicola TaxID=2724939 RepID=A0ABX1SHU6_9PSEU|nr:lycopene cyclase family protein [Pseudonocardia acidicola]